MASMGCLQLRIYILSSCSTHGLLRGKAICSLPAIVFCSTDYFCSQSFLRPLLNACHMPSTILATRDTAVSVLIQPLFQQRRKCYQLSQVWLQQRSSCSVSFQPIWDTFGAEAKQSFDLLIREWRGGSSRCRVHGLRETVGGIPLWGSCHLRGGGVLVAGEQGSATLAADCRTRHRVRAQAHCHHLEVHCRL